MENGEWRMVNGNFQNVNNKPLEDQLNTIEKYNNMIDSDFVNDLRDDGMQVEIARCEEFQTHAYNTAKNSL